MLEALQLVALEAYADRYPAQLSGGQQQRVAVARALVNRPAVLLLDEPLGSLDLKLRKRLQVELSQIQREIGTTFVFVTHDQGEAMTMADRIAVMNEGRVEQIGTAEGDLQPAGFAVRRRFHRRVELRRGRVRRGRGDDGTRQGPAAVAGRRGFRDGDVDGASGVGPSRARFPGRSKVSSGPWSSCRFSGNFTRASIDCPAVDDPFIVDMPTELHERDTGGRISTAPVGGRRRSVV